MKQKIGMPIKCLIGFHKWNNIELGPYDARCKICNRIRKRPNYTFEKMQEDSDKIMEEFFRRKEK